MGLSGKNAKQGGGRRTAVIAIHGVADQQQGDTARAVAHLLATGGNAGARYEGVACDSVVLGVPILCPANVLPIMGTAAVAGNAESAAGVPADPANAQINSNGKALRQSVTSDFQRAGWVATGSAKMASAGAGADAQTLEADSGRSAPTAMAGADLGIAFSDYLLSKAVRNGSPDESYEATRICMTRTAGGGAQRVDVHEMYWADLSRMSGQVPRIIGELFTMLFRFSRLGRDAVDQTALERKTSNSALAPRWAMLARFQSALDWAFAGVLSHLFLQVFVVLTMIALIRAAQPYSKVVHSSLVLALPAAGLAWFYFRQPGAWPRRMLAVGVGMALTVLLALSPPSLTIGFGVTGLLVVLCVMGLRVAETRFPSTKLSGMLFLLISMGIIGVELIRLGLGSTQYTDGSGMWLMAAMRALEYLLLGIVAWWSVVPLFMLAWLVMGAWLIRSDPDRRAAVVTGQLALFGSVAAFLAITMAIWAVLTEAAMAGPMQTTYVPLYFDREVSIAGSRFLELRYQKSTQSFALVACMLLVLGGYLLVMLIPSVIAELQLRVGNGRSLGRWLSRGYAGLDRSIRIVVTFAVVSGIVVGILILLNRVDGFPKQFGPASEFLENLSLTVLNELVIGAATGAAVFVAFGGLLSRFVPGLRLPLDVALDVDNHFREFPRRAIPRARIYARYVALLEHLVVEGYDDIVIVAHSQGTVITAELLRYLSYRAQHEPKQDDRVARLWEGLEGRLSLLTAGCPLRQLYAARFPAQYAWVHEQAGPPGGTGAPGPATAGGPSSEALGVQRWVNLYASGDYVGRWLWSSPANTEELDAADLYEAATLVPSHRHQQVDVCLGSGAHTHYFDVGQRSVAMWIDALIGAPHSAALEKAA